MPMSIEIKGVAETIATLGLAAALEILNDPMQRAVMRLQTDLANYPPQPPTTYRRTGRLGRSWTTQVQRTGAGMIGEVGNNVTYAPFVQSSQFQARWMRHWRNTDEAVLRDNESDIVADFEQAITKALNG